MIWKDYLVTFKMRSRIPLEEIKEGIEFQLGEAIPCGIHLVPEEIATLQVVELHVEASDVASDNK